MSLWKNSDHRSCHEQVVVSWICQATQTDCAASWEDDLKISGKTPQLFIVAVGKGIKPLL